MEASDTKIVVGELLAVEVLTGGKLKKTEVQIDDEKTRVTVVTNAPNVTQEKIGESLIVALPGAELPGIGQVGKATVGGCVSEGVLCDSQMLHWKGGGAGTAVFVTGLPLGSAPPAQRPRPKNPGPELPPPEPGLFAKKPSKEEKKALARAQREARKAAKLKKKDESTTAAET